MLFNQLFEETSYNIIGFTETDKGFSFVVEQPFIKGRLLNELVTSPETDKIQNDRVAKFMEERFSMLPAGLYAYGNPELKIEDVHLRNVIEGEDGNLYVIDAIPSINMAAENIVDNQLVRESAINTQLNWSSNEDVVSNIPEEDGLPLTDEGEMDDGILM